MIARIGSKLAAGKAWLLVTLLGLPLITPFFRLYASACTHDGHLHYHRVAAIYHAWQNGLYFSRWLPDLAFGYGYPFFVFREGAPLYLTLIPYSLGLPLPAAVNLFYIVCILAAGWFMYLWVRDIFGPTAAVVAAVAYMAAPYQLIDAIIRGNQPESLALPLFPLLLWAGRRFVLRGSAVPFLISVFGLLFLALSHNISLLLFTPVLFIYLALVVWLNRLDLKTAVLRIFVIFSFGLGLTAFYVGPALLELDEITISQSVTTRNNDFRFNFATLDEIFAPVQSADPSLLNQPLLIRLGWVPTLLAVAGVGKFVLTQRRRETETQRDEKRTAYKDEQAGHIFMMAVAVVGFLFMSLAVSRPLWDHVPLIEFVQFPWRFIGRAALPIAFLSGSAFARINANNHQSPVTNQQAGVRPSTQLPAVSFTANYPITQSPISNYKAILPAVAVVLLLLEALPYLYPHYCLDDPFPTIQTVHDYEHSTGLVGVDPEGSYFPITVQERPQSSPLEADYQAGRPPHRFDSSQLPDGAVVELADYTPLTAEIRLDTPAAFQARYFTFAFPGWTVLVDGSPVAITPSDPEGLITFPIPAGQHTIEVSWEMTPLRQTMSILSLLCLVGVVITAVLLYTESSRNEGETAVSPKPASRLPFAALLLAALLFLAFKLLLIDRVDTPLRQETGPTVDNPAVLQANDLQFAGYNIAQQPVAAGESFDIDLAWQVLAQPSINYQSNVWLIGPDGNIWSDKETYRPRIYESTAPTSLWVANQWAWDSREVRVLPGTPPGSYDIVLTLFNLADLEPVTLLETDGRVRGPTAVIGTITVTRPDRPPKLQPQYPLDVETAGLHLLGYNQDRTEAIPGEQMLLTLFWEKKAGQTPADTLELSLLDSSGQVVQSWQLSPVRADYPPSAWEAGERLRGQHALQLAAGLESGRYQFQLNDIPLGSLTINAPDRLFTRPDFETAVNADFGDQVELIGYTVEENAATLSVTLVWQGLAEMPISYRVFVHLVNESGEIITQSDGEPANWTRPTTGWAEGEYIVDSHELVLPDGGLPASAVLRVGLYDPT
ncbi:MAG: 6-pyruvoyl-tetrahydropterin synthase-related protein, partial [Candidatus Promineifilaceae bacterium]